VFAFSYLIDLVLAVAAPRAALVAENLLLRQQLIVARRGVKRPRLRRFERWLFGVLASRSRRLLDAVLLVKPSTVIGWHRAAWRLMWRWRSGRPPGRPPVDADLRALIRRIWRENPTWGQKIIAAELAKLGTAFRRALLPSTAPLAWTASGASGGPHSSAITSTKLGPATSSSS